MTRRIFDPRMLDRLRNFFPSKLDVMSSTFEPDEMGSPESDFVPVYAGVPCSISPFTDAGSSGERKGENLSFSIATHRITLKGNYPLITPKMVAVFDDKNHDILRVDFDSHEVQTRLIVNEVTI